MIVTIHQPEHMPWLGFFNKMLIADAYVYLDNVQFSKRNFQNRNRIISPSGEIYWIVVPLKMKGYLQKKLFDMQICYEVNWQKKYWGVINACYVKSPFFHLYKNRLEKIIFFNYKYILDLNIELINFFREILQVSTPIKRASEISSEGQSSELLLALNKALGASIYLSGPFGINYLKEEIFLRNNINVKGSRLLYKD